MSFQSISENCAIRIRFPQSRSIGINASKQQLYSYLMSSFTRKPSIVAPWVPLCKESVLKVGQFMVFSWLPLCKKLLRLAKLLYSHANQEDPTNGCFLSSLLSFFFFLFFLVLCSFSLPWTSVLLFLISEISLD